MNLRSFGKANSSEEVQLYTLANKNGVEMGIITYGAVITSLKVPDRSGKFADVVLGYNELAGWLRDTCHFGGIIGRYANRIALGEFTLHGKPYKLARNNGENHLHGGHKGFDRVVWTARDMSRSNVDALQLEYVSAAGEEGYPGTLTTQVIYSLDDENELKIQYAATTDDDTVINLTNHSYFNLTGDTRKDVLAHEVMLNAAHFTPVDSTLIPTGEIRDVAGTAFDFRKSMPIGARIDDPDPQLKYGAGYDHNWVLNLNPERMSRLVARVREPFSGRLLEVYTSEPGIQFYTGNQLDGSVRGKNGKYLRRSGFCLETQHFPDSPNHPEFPSTVLKPGGRFESTTVFKFSVE
ncbi:MAG TPA: aldose epimerase family protein [Candidatus Eremiobacteraceae bacterium]|nr:aldose epimerase family protein [Candidatus Eremiobacteraceae bacterium]